MNPSDIIRLPHPIASLVLFNNGKYYIKEVAFNHRGLHKYSIKKDAEGIAWVNHDDLCLVELPTYEGWKNINTDPSFYSYDDED